MNQYATEGLSTEIYDIFISYNKADIEFAERLVKRIEQEPYRNGYLKCFYAAWDINAGENILLKIENALSNSRFVGLVISPDWLKSDWTTLERVIPVYEDPAGLKARIIPILRRNCDIPPTIRILKWLDFRTESNFDREIRKLLARLRGESYRALIDPQKADTIPSQPFDSTIPEVQEEILASNIFQILQIPMFLNRALAKVKKRSDVWDMLGEGVSLPIFAIREDSQQIFSFVTLNNPQQKITQIVQDPSADRISISEILDSNEATVIIELLNRAMTEHMKNIGMVYDWKNKKTFFPLEKDGDDSRYANWKVGNREYPRFVVKRTKSGRYYVHRSCKATFTQMGDHIFLKVLPGWHFTTDGLFEAVSPNIMSSLSSRWMNIQRNHSVLDDVRFWIYKLSRGTERIEMDVGTDNPVIIASIPFAATISHGIEEDYRERLWADEEPSPDESEKALEKEDEETIEEGEEAEEESYE